MKLINRWSVRLALVGVALGFLQSYQLFILPEFMTSFGIPFAIILAAFGVLIDFSLAKKNGTDGFNAMPGRLISKWSIRLGLLGLPIGVGQYLLSGGNDLEVALGFSIPYAVILASLGLLIDFSVAKKRRKAASAPSSS
jgi:uncharacterized YccA/Bax inhibitor family protein